MDNKNVFVAIALSMAVLLFWGAFFETPRQVKENQTSGNVQTNKNIVQGDITPNINQDKTIKKISRKDALTEVDRVIIENKKVTGSISLKGAIFDDLSFRNYKKDLKSDENVVLLNPKQIEDGYYIESGWASVGNEVDVPGLDSLWQVKGNRVLNNKNDVVLEWNNGKGLTFKKTIKLDDKYLFKIEQEVKNNTSQKINLYPYSQITRNKKPDDVMGFYILHEGFIGVFDGELKEDDYDDIKEKKIIIHNAPFDLGFLDGELSFIKKNKIDKKFVVDTLETARNKFPGSSNSLDALCRKFNIDLSKRVKHNALLDCELLREVYINLVDVREPKFNLSSVIHNEKNFVGSAKSYSKNVLEISEVEKKKHQIFLKSELKKNFY